MLHGPHRSTDALRHPAPPLGCTGVGAPPARPWCEHGPGRRPGRPWTSGAAQGRSGTGHPFTGPGSGVDAQRASHVQRGPARCRSPLSRSGWVGSNSAWLQATAARAILSAAELGSISARRRSVSRGSAQTSSRKSRASSSGSTCRSCPVQITLVEPECLHPPRSLHQDTLSGEDPDTHRECECDRRQPFGHVGYQQPDREVHRVARCNPPSGSRGSGMKATPIH